MAWKDSCNAAGNNKSAAKQLSLGRVIAAIFAIAAIALSWFIWFFCQGRESIGAISPVTTVVESATESVSSAVTNSEMIGERSEEVVAISSRRRMARRRMLRRKLIKQQQALHSGDDSGVEETKEP